MTNLVEAVALVQLENRAQVDIGLAGPRLHLHGEVPRIQGGRGRQTIAELDVLQVFEDFLIAQTQPVADAQAGFGIGKLNLGIQGV